MMWVVFFETALLLLKVKDKHCWKRSWAKSVLISLRWFRKNSGCWYEARRGKGHPCGDHLYLFLHLNPRFLPFFIVALKHKHLQVRPQTVQLIECRWASGIINRMFLLFFFSFQQNIRVVVHHCRPAVLICWSSDIMAASLETTSLLSLTPCRVLPHISTYSLPSFPILFVPLFDSWVQLKWDLRVSVT